MVKLSGSLSQSWYTGRCRACSSQDVTAISKLICCRPLAFTVGKEAPLAFWVSFIALLATASAYRSVSKDY